MFNKEAEMTGKEVSGFLKLTVSKLHYYEREKLISPKRDSNNYRIYTKEDIMKLKCILILKNLNFSIAKIKELVSLYETCEENTETRNLIENIYGQQIEELERKKEEYTNIINLFKAILLFEKPEEGKEKEADKLIEKIYGTYIEKEGMQ
jgi:DNA-binding transcriptional MerR regulator